MNITAEKKPGTLLFNPFVYIAGAQALVIGLGGILLAAVIGSLSNTHFDGALDMHSGAAAPLWVFLAEGLVDWLCLALVLLLAGRIASQTPFRTIDLLGTQAMARWPTVLLSLVCLSPGLHRFTNEVLQQLQQGNLNFNFATGDAVIFFLSIFAMIPLFCWMIFLMYKSFSFCCNVKGGKAILSFVVGIIIAEVLSKIAVVHVLKIAGV